MGRGITNPVAYGSRIEIVGEVDRLLRAAIANAPALPSSFDWTGLIEQFCAMVATSRRLASADVSFLYTFFGVPDPTLPQPEPVCSRCRSAS